MKKFEKKEFAKKIITTASASWHNAKLTYKNDNIESSKKNVFHALRILSFGEQIKDNKTITNHSMANFFKVLVETNQNFKPKNFYKLFMTLSEELKENE